MPLIAYAIKHGVKLLGADLKKLCKKLNIKPAALTDGISATTNLAALVALVVHMNPPPATDDDKVEAMRNYLWKTQASESRDLSKLLGGAPSEQIEIPII